MVDSEAVQVTLLVTTILGELGVPHVIGGSLASIIYGRARATMDVDIVADMNLEHVVPFIAGLSGEFYADEQTVRRAIQQRTSFSLIHLATMFKVDVFIPKGRSFDRQQIARRVLEEVDLESGEALWVLSPEDVVLAKLDWFRLGGEVSERQWRDILGVIKNQRDSLDISYMQQWASALDVADLLDHAFEESDKD